MTSVEIRGAKQWDAAVRKAAKVSDLEVHGPASLSLEGIERMVNVRYVTLADGAPTNQLYRMKELPRLERVSVELGTAPHDLDSLLDCRIPSLELYAFNARRALELAALPFDRVGELERLSLFVFTTALVAWDCRWLSRAADLRELVAIGLYPWPDEARRVLRSARQLRELAVHANPGDDYVGQLAAEEAEDLETWRAEMQAALPQTVVRPQSWWPRPRKTPSRWEIVAVDEGAAYVTTVGSEALVQLRARVNGPEQLTRLLERWTPMLARRTQVATTGDGIRIQARTAQDLVFIEELLTLGTPEDPDAAAPLRDISLERLNVGSPADNAAVHSVLTAFLQELRARQITDDESAAARWAQAVRELEADGVQMLDDTAVRDQLYEILQQPLADAGIDAEYVILTA